MIDEQPHVELGPGQPRDRQRLEALAQRGAGDRDRIDDIGLAALARRLARAGHQLRRHPHDALAAREQEPLQRAGHVPAVLDRPHPLATNAARPAQQIIKRAALRANRQVGEHAPVAASTAPTVCETLCVSAPITIIFTSPSCGVSTNGSPVDTSQSGRCHAPIKSRRRSSDGGGRHNHRQSDQGRQQAKESARRRTEDLPGSVGRHRPTTKTFSLRSRLRWSGGRCRVGSRGRRSRPGPPSC